MQRSALDAEVRRSVNEKLEKSGEKERYSVLGATRRCIWPTTSDAPEYPSPPPHPTG